jgi:CHAD domain-containing protein
MFMAQRSTIVPSPNSALGHSFAQSGGAKTFLQGRFKDRWRPYRKSLKRVRSHVSEKAIHELRIETRRILALLQLMHPFCPPEYVAEAEKRFTKIFNASGSLRDTQVQRKHIKGELKRYPELVPFRKWLRRREERQTLRFKKCVKRKSKVKLFAATRTLRNWFRRSKKQESVHNLDHIFFLEKIETMYLDVLRLRKAVQPNRPSTIHRLRIAFKAYRYMIEILSPEILRVPSPLMNHVREYQTIMGNIQDVEVLLGLLDKFQKVKRKANLSVFRAELKRRHADCINRFMATPFPGAIPLKGGS